MTPRSLLAVVIPVAVTALIAWWSVRESAEGVTPSRSAAEGRCSVSAAARKPGR